MGGILDTLTDTVDDVTKSVDVIRSEMDYQGGLTTNELEMIRESPSRLWHHYCSEPCFETPKSALLQLMKFTKMFKSEFQELSMELKLNMLTFIENTLSLIRFMTNSFDDLNHTSVDALNEFHDDIVSLSINLDCISPSEVEHQLRRINSDYTDIVTALAQIRQREERGTVNITHAEGCSDVWQPFFSSPSRFETEVERDFITALRGLYLGVEDLDANEILEEIIRIFVSTPTGILTFSFESSRDTAMRSVLVVLMAVRRKAFQELDFFGLTEARRNFLESSFSIMYSAITTQNPAESSASYRKLCKARWQCMAAIIHPINDSHTFPRSASKSLAVFEQEPKSALYVNSELWRKLTSVASVKELLEGEDKNCSDCLAGDITSSNFAIMDGCTHIFCKHCIEDWFKTRGSCPNCRTRVRSWTTKDCFIRFLEQNSTAMVPSRSEAGSSLNKAVEPSRSEPGRSFNKIVELFLSKYPEAGDSTNGAVELFLAEVGHSTNGAVETSRSEPGSSFNKKVELFLSKYPEAGDCTNGAVELFLAEVGYSTNGAVDQSRPEAGDSTNGAVEPSRPEAGDSTNGAVEPSRPEAGDSTNGAVEPSRPEAGDSTNGAVEPSQAQAEDSRVSPLILE